MYQNNWSFKVSPVVQNTLSHLPVFLLIVLLAFNVTNAIASEQLVVKRIGAVPVSMTGRVVANRDTFETDHIAMQSTVSTELNLSSVCENQPTPNESALADVVQDNASTCIEFEAGKTIIWM